MADMAAIGWGSARYLDLALIRAKCWVKCHRAFPQHSSLTLTTLTSRELSDTADNGADDADDGIENDNLVPLLGKVSFRLESRISKAALQVTWHIDLDWIGDVESRVSATASLPPRWIERDGQRDSLSKIPKTFELLVRKVGVFEAIKVLVGLVLGT